MRILGYGYAFCAEGGSGRSAPLPNGQDKFALVVYCSGDFGEYDNKIACAGASVRRFGESYVCAKNCGAGVTHAPVGQRQKELHIACPEIVSNAKYR